jgi:hypothetical protein
MRIRRSFFAGPAFVALCIVACSSSNSTTSAGPQDGNDGGDSGSASQRADGGTSVGADGATTDGSSGATGQEGGTNGDAGMDAAVPSCPPDLTLSAPVTGVYQYDSAGGPAFGGQPEMAIADGTYVLTALVFYTMQQGLTGQEGNPVAQTIEITGGNMKWSGQDGAKLVRTVTATLAVNTAAGSIDVGFTCGTNKNPTQYVGGYYFSGTELQIPNFSGILTGYSPPQTFRTVATYTKM